MEASDPPFWTWSLAIYGRPGVEQGLLELQDRHGLDVNMLLFACWLAVDRRRPLSINECKRLLAATADWRDNVIRPLRGIRRFLKSNSKSVGAESLRAKVKRLELEAERVMQLKISAMSTHEDVCGEPASDPADAALIGLEACLAAAGIAATERDRYLLSTLARACCG